MKKKKAASEKLKKQIVEAILDKKGNEVIELDLREIDSSIADFFIISHGDSNTQVSAISDAVYKTVKDEMELLPAGTEGKTNANWIVLDYFDVVVHVFHRESRQYYQLEELWSDALLVEHK